MKKYVIVFVALLPHLAIGNSQTFEVSIALTARDVPAYLSLLNTKVGLRLPTKVLSDYAESIAVDNEFSDRIDVHFQGGVHTVLYQIAKTDSGEVYFSFMSLSKEIAAAICQQMDEFSHTTESARALTNCKLDLLESITA